MHKEAHKREPPHTDTHAQRNIGTQTHTFTKHLFTYGTEVVEEESDSGAPLPPSVFPILVISHSIQ